MTSESLQERESVQRVHPLHRALCAGNLSLSGRSRWSVAANAQGFVQRHPLGGTGLFITVVSSAALGLLLDEARHTIFEEALTKSWSIRAGYDPHKLKEDFVGYIPPMTPELYAMIRDEGYYYYEFDLNMGMALILAALVLPRYLWVFQRITERVAWSTSVGLLGLGICVGLWFGYSAYVYSIRSFVSAMDNLQPGFAESIKVEKGGEN